MKVKNLLFSAIKYTRSASFPLVHETRVYTSRWSFLLLFVSPWAVFLQKPIQMWRWEEMPVGFECWWVVVNIPDERASNDVWCDLLTTCCCHLPFRRQRAEALWISWVLLETLSRRLLKIHYICRTEALQCTGGFIKKTTEVGYANQNEAEEERVCGGGSGGGRVSEGSREKVKGLTQFSRCCSSTHSGHTVVLTVLQPTSLTQSRHLLISLLRLHFLFFFLFNFHFTIFLPQRCWLVPPNRHSYRHLCKCCISGRNVNLKGSH